VPVACAAVPINDTALDVVMKMPAVSLGCEKAAAARSVPAAILVEPEPNALK